MNKTIIAFALTAAPAFAPSDADALPFLPDFSTATLAPGAPVDNPFFPLLDNYTRVFAGQKEENGEIVSERFELKTLGQDPTILGVQTTARRDRAFEDNRLVEATLDYYAQDTAGNVWYFGEDVTNYIYDAAGNLIDTNHASAWRAGVNGALPGYIMPADLTPGFNYYQEFASSDGALDQATTVTVGNAIAIDIGSFTDVVQILEGTELQPEVRELKYYARGHGLILVEEGVNSGLEDPEITLELIAVIPAPSTILLLGWAWRASAAGAGTDPSESNRVSEPNPPAGQAF